jgi:hypothetical protein
MSQMLCSTENDVKIRSTSLAPVTAVGVEDAGRALLMIEAMIGETQARVELPKDFRFCPFLGYFNL